MKSPTVSMLQSQYSTTPALDVRRKLVGSPIANQPLTLFRDDCLRRDLCNEDGTRRAGVHWVLSFAMNADQGTQPPNLRTISVYRVSGEGIDFCVKKGSVLSNQLVDPKNEAGLPVSMLHLQGRYVEGEMTQQWRGDGMCYPMPLDTVLPLLPSWSVSAMVGSTRLEAEDGGGDEAERSLVKNKAHTTEVMQRARVEAESGKLSFEEQDASMQALRFVPYRLECMSGGPETIMWERLQWKRAEPNSENSEDWKNAEWNTPDGLLPH